MTRRPIVPLILLWLGAALVQAFGGARSSSSDSQLRGDPNVLCTACGPILRDAGGR